MLRALILFVPATAYANPVVAPLMVVWPMFLVLIIPIILVERLYARGPLKMGFWRAIRVIGVANLASWLAGIPIAIAYSFFLLEGVALVVADVAMLVVASSCPGG